MMSGPIPPSAPSRTIPSASIQKWTGRARAFHVSAADPVGVEAQRERRGERLGEGSDRALVLLDVDRDDDEAVGRVPGREPVHQRELVLARRTPGGHEVDPDRLALEVGQVDRPAADLRDDERRGRLPDLEQGAPGRRRAGRTGGAGTGRRAPRTGSRTGLPTATATVRRGRRSQRGPFGRQHEDAAQHEGGDQDPGQQAGHDRRGAATWARRVPVPAGGGVYARAAARMPLRWPI